MLALYLSDESFVHFEQ